MRKDPIVLLALLDSELEQSLIDKCSTAARGSKYDAVTFNPGEARIALEIIASGVGSHRDREWRRWAQSAINQVKR